MKKLLFMSVFYFFFACSKDEPKKPAIAKLIFPLENSECTVGQNINQTTRLINFQWEAAAHTQRYTLKVVNLNTNISQSVNTNNTAIELPLMKGVPYSWSVVSANTAVTETATSEVWNFFNAGTQTTHAPFPTKIITPLSGNSILKDINNEVTLTWQGSDIDGDIAAYEVYFSTAKTAMVLVGNTNRTTQEFKVSVASNTVYFWSVKTVDAAGNSASSGIFSFRVL